MPKIITYISPINPLWVPFLALLSPWKRETQSCLMLASPLIGLEFHSRLFGQQSLPLIAIKSFWHAIAMLANENCVDLWNFWSLGEQKHFMRLYSKTKKLTNCVFNFLYFRVEGNFLESLIILNAAWCYIQLRCVLQNPIANC